MGEQTVKPLSIRMSWRRTLFLFAFSAFLFAPLQASTAQEQRYRGKTTEEWVYDFLRESGYQRGDRAARALGSIGAAAVPAWIDALRQETRYYPDIADLQLAARGMGETLIPFVLSDKTQSQPLDIDVARALLHSMPELAADDLVELLNQSKKTRMKRFCIAALMKRAPQKSILRALIRAGQTRDSELQIAVAEAFRDMKGIEKHREAFLVLLRFLRSSSYPVRRASICAVLSRPWAESQVENALDLFFLRRFQEIDVFERSLLFKALKTRPQFGPILAQWAESSDRKTGGTALQLLGSIPKAHRNFAEVFRRALRHRNRRRTVEALLGLSAMGAEAHVFLPTLLRLLNSSDRDRHHFIYRIIRTLGRRAFAAKSRLLEMAKKGDRTQGRESIYCLGFIGYGDREVLDFLIQQLNSSIVWRQRIAMRTLSVLKAREERVFKVLGRFLNGEHGVSTQRIALETLIALKASADFWKAHLKAPLGQDRDARRFFYFCLHEIGPDAAAFIPDLFRFFHREKTDDARSNVIHALVAVGPSNLRVLRFLLKLCKNPAGPKQRLTQKTVIKKLVAMRGIDLSEARSTLLQLAKKSPRTRPWMIETVLALKARPPWLKATLLELFKSERAGALENLAKLEACSTTELLINLYENDNLELRLRAVEEMIPLRGQSQKIKNCLMRGLQEPSWKLRLRCLEGLRGLATVTDKERLLVVKRVEDVNWRVRHAAVVTLGTLKRGHAPTKSALIKALRDESQIIRTAAALAISRVCRGAQNVEAPLRQCLNDWDERVRCMSLYALGRVGWTSKESLQRLIQLLEHESLPTRRWTLVALSHCPGNLLGDLYERMEENFDDHALDLKTVILRIGSPCKLLLARKLRSKDISSRCRAAYFVSVFGKEGRSALFRALEDPEGIVREMAARALAEHGPIIEQELIQYLEKRPAAHGAFLALKLLCGLNRISGKAFPYLLNALEQPELHWQCLVIEALSRIDVDARVIMVHLGRRWHDPHWIVRAKARRALVRLGKTD